MKRILIVILIFAIGASAYTWFFVWNKPQLNVKNADAVKTEAAALFAAYSTNEKAANANYIDKIVEVSGEAGTVSKNAEGLDVVFLKSNDPMFGIICTMEEKNTQIKAGDKVTLKGICTGYLTDVVLIRCYKTY
ncbi:MAG: OB-fold protein [Ferruginibacter sp.]